ncbi:aminobenzoyl-glutamate transport protein [Bacillus pakistanensis]|uniref:Aminobenzoyl-glutamate transport protein n=1 Tax=Rossellomorea pakistanensis TaxID=992288 RepID=A0ABS2NC00_9BACI|nr:AbgT family transporter [Bacillus pakistanensis]MBM7585380.1 aminobenzoyl-glutamate transport protein [Bacillus pakistanensis]
MEPNQSFKKKNFDILGGIEHLGNRLPHPVGIFLYITLFVIIASWVFSLLGTSVIHPGTNENTVVKSLISVEGIQYILTSLFSNFIEFKPLGLVLVFALGIGVAEKVGLFEATIKKTLMKAPKSVITYAVMFMGIMGSITADSAYLIVPPIAAMIFHLFGRHPMAGLAAGIAATGCGFTANLFVGVFDVMLSGISTEIVQTIYPNLVVNSVDNWYFMSASVFVLTFVGVFVTEKIVEPRLGKYTGEVEIQVESNDNVDSLLINKALRNTLIAAVIYFALIICVFFIPSSPLSGEETSLFMSVINTLVFLFFIIIGLTYGITAKKINNVKDMATYMGESIKDMSGFIVLVFIIAQFIAYLEWSNLTIVTAVKGAELLKSGNVEGLPAILLLIIVTSLSSLFITSGSALWSVLGPVVLPMYMLLDFHPAFIQVAYRIGDSVTNMITPMQPFVAVMLGFLMKYDKKAGLGTHIALILPYTIAFLIAWMIMFTAFALLDIPVGPGVPMYLEGK